MSREKIELKSLKILNAVLECKSVTAAAEMLSVSPSSITYAINKLRDITTNPILTRSKSGVVPTTLAIDLNSRYVKAMSLINEGLDITDTNTDSGHIKEIVISTYTFFEFWLSMSLLRNGSLKKEGVSLTFIPHPFTDEERTNNLRNRKVDIDIGTELPKDNSITVYKLLSSNTQAMVSQSHPTIKNQLTVDDWHSNEHVRWTRADYGMTSMVGDAVTLNDVRNYRNILVNTSSSLNMMLLCANSDNIMIIPRMFSSFLKTILPVNFFDIPFEVDIHSDYYLHFHNQSLNDININRVFSEINKLVGK
ncbi:LysR family transcriptional regulator [Buttiauxella selenatireducens]|uniref:LysR family transcriptional regulator n=1 Tax=Buttiauxella selenatireducens TaxID=3073902 RepID=A0ABY9S5C1_9ENTR|nr:LysR family transcriptional regulator [Buttiauxella sp. R73]WMY72704.1 LysR family transcriptional regulator [Buttiauxella sp. R73]